jgi:hypothetical protein
MSRQQTALAVSCAGLAVCDQGLWEPNRQEFLSQAFDLLN